MHADLTRDTFDATKHFSRVLIQQGRVPLDADLNEQASILLHHQRRLAADIIGPHGGPKDATGFKIERQADGKLLVGKGRYYVDGILVESDDDATDYFAQPNLRLDAKNDKLPDPPYVVVLHVWERHKSAAEDETILEPALGGPDTASRAQVVWQVRTYPASEIKPGNPDSVTSKDIVDWLTVDPSGTMRARIPATEADTDPCVLSPKSRFRGLENQLYRVEIHVGGTIDKDGNTVGSPRPTFKWSRENGSVVFPVRTLRGNRAHVETLGRDDRIGVHEGDRVEVLSDDVVLRGDKPAPIATVQEVDRDAMAIELANASLPTYDGTERHPFLRRWDQQDPTRVSRDTEPVPDVDDVDLIDGAVPIDARWIDLESGIQVQFGAGKYRPGDYWLIPARTATGDIQWPTEKDAAGNVVASMRPPRGMERHYAPLAIIRLNGAVTECRNCFAPIATPCP